MEGSQAIDKLRMVLTVRRPILFTGAGFSYGGKKRDGSDLPLGNGLKLMLLKDISGFKSDSPEFLELSKEPLMKVCEYCEFNHSSALKTYLIELFTGCIPAPYHKIILEYPWKKIYTTNIDDLVENAFDEKDILVQNMSRRKSDWKQVDRLEYVKLHGCVRNQESGFVFSQDQYIDSMLKSTDYRFNSFGQDIQDQDFIFLGTGDTEINLDYYFNLYKSSPTNTSRGFLFYVNPNPSFLLTEKVRSLGGYVIKWTSEQLASFICEINSNKKSSSEKPSIFGFSLLESYIEELKGEKLYDSNLYLGYNPNWKDILFDWDFHHFEAINDFKSFYQNISSGLRPKSSIYILVGKSLSGKSTILKRLGYSLYRDGYVVASFVGKEMNPFSIINYIKQTRVEKLCLLIDNASYYYGAFKTILSGCPDYCHLIILGTSRPYFHQRKKYIIITESFHEFNIPQGISYSYANEIAEKLNTKGYLGSFKGKDKDFLIRSIRSANDVSNCLYQITYGKSFKERFSNDYDKRSHSFVYGQKLLDFVTIFHKLDLAYFPLEIATLVFQANTNKALSEIDDFIKYNGESKGIALRNPILEHKIIGGLSPEKISERIKEILINISPQVIDRDHSYWSEIEAALLKEKLLRKRLSLNTRTIRGMLFDIKPYYIDSYNYWIQVGISEQMNGDYEKALNHFQQAEALNPNSYMVQNAIARNFLKQANSLDDENKARDLFLIGEERMLRLIKEREEFQVKAYSTHCYLYEKINYLRRFHIVAKDEELKSMFAMLKQILDKVPEDDGMSRSISNKFYRYLEECKKTGIIKLEFSDLSALKSMLAGYEIDIESLFEDFEIEG